MEVAPAKQGCPALILSILNVHGVSEVGSNRVSMRMVLRVLKIFAITRLYSDISSGSKTL